MIKILKASAGSGKTYNLAQTYIRLLLENESPEAYRHILAVTFTNKATDEMKNRILKELYTLSVTPDKSKYLESFVPSLFQSNDLLQKKAAFVLQNILHDYGAFAVSTIDRFFQQTLKAFSREIGQFASYQVELDQDSLVSESVDRILDSLSEDQPALLKWLSDSVMEQLGQGKRFNLEGSLLAVALRLKSEEYRSVIEKYGIDEEQAYSKENLSRMKDLFRKVSENYLNSLKGASSKIEEAFKSAGVQVGETSRHFMQHWLAKIDELKPGSGVPPLTDAFRRNSEDFSGWFKKADQPKYSGLEGVLLPPVADFVKCYDAGIKTFQTVQMLYGQINDLVIAADLSKVFTDLMKEKNVLSIDDSNVLLKNIIDGSDAPFVYEKLGVRFEHFLLDEFQDTSRIQWDNFRPLVENSDSQNFENLLVGDVKQSIYRWRGSDWRLMENEVQAQFPDAETGSLKGNWRSLGNIVRFNNDFFTYAARTLDSMYGEGPSVSVSSLYGVTDGLLAQDVEVKDKNGSEGNVEAIFCQIEEENQRILDTVAKVRSAGAKPGDITVLVRNNQEGSEVANFLQSQGIDVISDDTLSIKSSLIVRKIVSLLSCVNNPEDTIGSYLALHSGLDVDKAAFLSLPDLCEHLLRLLREKDETASSIIKEESQYVQSFMDYVQDYVSANGNELDAFLKTWNEASPRLSSSAELNAVSVMTIHKAKGLEFPYVILPYSEKVIISRGENHWAVPDVTGTPLQGGVNAAFDVGFSTRCEGTCFADEYRENLLLQYIDNINTYYVALTRASKGMTIISGLPKKDSTSFADFSQILHAYLDECGEAAGFVKEEADDGEGCIFRKGGFFDYSGMDRKNEDGEKIELDYPSFPLNPEKGDEETDVRERGRLKFSADSVDFFNDEAKADVSARMNGTVLHDILSNVISSADLAGAVEKALQSGDIDKEQADSNLDLLSRRLASHKEWFPEGDEEVLTETSLIDTDGKEYRPDRVVIKDGAVTVIDYKFGEKNPKYKGQVSRYAGIYRRMGYQNVSSAIWYVVSDEVE